MTKEDPMTYMNANEKKDVSASYSKNSYDKKFSEKLGSKLKKTIKSSSLKIKKSFDKTNNHSEAGDNTEPNNISNSTDLLSEKEYEFFDNDYSNPYLRDYSTVNKDKKDESNFGISKTEEKLLLDKNGNKIDKDDLNNDKLYDEFSHYTMSKWDHDEFNKTADDNIPNYSEISIEKSNEKQQTTFFTNSSDDKRMNSSDNVKEIHQNYEKSSLDTPINQIKMTSQSHDSNPNYKNGLNNQSHDSNPNYKNGLNNQFSNQTFVEQGHKNDKLHYSPKSFLRDPQDNVTSTSLPQVSSLSISNSEKLENSISNDEDNRTMYDRAKNTAKGMMDTVIDKFTPNNNKHKKEKDKFKKDTEDTNQLNYLANSSENTNPQTNSVNTDLKMSSLETQGMMSDLSSVSAINSKNLKSGSKNEETLLNPNVDSISVNSSDASVFNYNLFNISNFSKVVVAAVDSSENSKYAVDWALNHFINREKDLIIFVNVRDDMTSIGSLDKEDENRIVSHELLKQYLKTYQDLEFSCRAISMKGDSKSEIVKKTNELGADLLIVGSRGMNAFKKLFIGSVSEYCVNNAECPVLIVKNKPKKITK